MATPNLIKSICQSAQLIREIRRDLHAHPELAYSETRTADLIHKLLSDWGIPTHRGLGGTGIVGIVKNGQSNRAVGLRADMDALPIMELNTFSHASTHKGIMHACGHDGHVAMLLAAAYYFRETRDFDGTVYLIFQPAEEGGAGAQKMIKDGLFDLFPMEAVFGMHNWPGLEYGRFAVAGGPIFASSSVFRILVTGKGVHAAMPHQGLDPIPAACSIVTALQTIVSRNISAGRPAVVSVARISAGKANNVIASTCEIEGTVRTFDVESLKMIEGRLRSIAEGTCEAFGVHCTFDFATSYPVTVNSIQETQFVERSVNGLVGPAGLVPFEPSMGSEDFSFFLNERPGCYFFIGNDDAGAGVHGGDPVNPSSALHSPTFDFNDKLIPLGGSIWVRIAENWLATSE